MRPDAFASDEREIEILFSDEDALSLKMCLPFHFPKEEGVSLVEDNFEVFFAPHGSLERYLAIVSGSSQLVFWPEDEFSIDDSIEIVSESNEVFVVTFSEKGEEGRYPLTHLSLKDLVLELEILQKKSEHRFVFNIEEYWNQLILKMYVFDDEIGEWQEWLAFDFDRYGNHSLAESDLERGQALRGQAENWIEINSEDEEVLFVYSQTPIVDKEILAAEISQLFNGAINQVIHDWIDSDAVQFYGANLSEIHSDSLMIGFKVTPDSQYLFKSYLLEKAQAHTENAKDLLQALVSYFLFLPIPLYDDFEEVYGIEATNLEETSDPIGYYVEAKFRRHDRMAALVQDWLAIDGDLVKPDQYVIILDNFLAQRDGGDGGEQDGLVPLVAEATETPMVYL